VGADLDSGKTTKNKSEKHYLGLQSRNPQTGSKSFPNREVSCLLGANRFTMVDLLALADHFPIGNDLAKLLLGAKRFTSVNLLALADHFPIGNDLAKPS
jgi:hypothetical protein